MTKIEGFTKELTALSIKHNLWINGCGCCGSPRVQELDEDELPEYVYVSSDDGDYADTLMPRDKCD